MCNEFNLNNGGTLTKIVPLLKLLATYRPKKESIKIYRFSCRKKLIRLGPLYVRKKRMFSVFVEIHELYANSPITRR